MVYPNYAWIIHGWYPDYWWEIGENLDGCANETLKEFIVKAKPLIVYFLPEPDDTDSNVTAAGMVSIEKLFIASTYTRAQVFYHRNCGDLA